MRHLVIVAALDLVCACRGEDAPPSSQARGSAPAAAPQKKGIAGEISAPDGAQVTGHLAITWRTHDEEGQLSLATIRHMIDRMTVSGADTDLGKTPRIPYELPDAPSDASPFAIFDVDHTFWQTFQGRGKGFVASGAIFFRIRL